MSSVAAVAPLSPSCLPYRLEFTTTLTSGFWFFSVSVQRESGGAFTVKVNGALVTRFKKVRILKVTLTLQTLGKQIYLKKKPPTNGTAFCQYVSGSHFLILT